jgi:hypothetical protein
MAGILLRQRLAPRELYNLEGVRRGVGISGGSAGVSSQSNKWGVATRVITGFQIKPEASRCFGEPMAGGGGRALLVARLRANPLDHLLRARKPISMRVGVLC